MRRLFGRNGNDRGCYRVLVGLVPLRTKACTEAARPAAPGGFATPKKPSQATQFPGPDAAPCRKQPDNSSTQPSGSPKDIFREISSDSSHTIRTPSPVLPGIVVFIQTLQGGVFVAVGDCPSRNESSSISMPFAWGSAGDSLRARDVIRLRLDRCPINSFSSFLPSFEVTLIGLGRRLDARILPKRARDFPKALLWIRDEPGRRCCFGGPRIPWQGPWLRSGCCLRALELCSCFFFRPENFWLHIAQQSLGPFRCFCRSRQRNRHSGFRISHPASRPSTRASSAPTKFPAISSVRQGENCWFWA